ncbi:hypothetical protein Bpfe_017174 [Biomphalaria pfeifferi]|uniref:Uncharacterized protein n=1 Tax=Biomphalaria pfeifferi TaxID=112525 RepID=A0AAD8BFL5_BIOPF|nr:hypothetical protein Bpfe_017174 [Biomphalaria pfeifferi]
MVNSYFSEVKSKQIAGKPNLEKLKMTVVDKKWTGERKDPRTSNADVNITFTVTKGQVKGFNKEPEISLPEGLPVNSLKFNPAQEKTENKSTNSQGSAFTAQVSLRVQLKGIVLLNDGGQTTETEFAQMIADLLKKKSYPLSVIEKKGIPDCVEWTIEGHVKIQ